MLATIILSTAISTYISPTKWTFEQGSDEFTSKAQARMVGHNTEHAFLFLTCNDNKHLDISVTYQDHNENLKTKAYAKVDQGKAIELIGSVYPSGLVAMEKYQRIKEWGKWADWYKLIKQMRQGKSVKFRLFNLKWEPQEVSFDLAQAKSGINDVLAQCGH